MSPSPAGSPPELKGYTFRRLLGSGGFADVFLYEQDRTRRDVAVKVLREHVAGPERAQITAEAEVMAQLSTHPYIVSVFDTDIAADGRPYLVMEYYPRYNLARRVRAGGLDVPEVLRLGVQLGSAVETAHRAGIVHRDIKPANILTSDYGRPGLTDFGIASSTGRTDAHEGHLSIPWAPPEAFAEKSALDSRADIYSLGATLWTLLAGRTPFEILDGENSLMLLISRIVTMPVPPTGRPDVPPSLDRALAQAMAKQPEHRFRTALELVRALQAVQHDMQLQVEPEALPDLGLTGTRGFPVIAAVDDDPSGSVTCLRPSDGSGLIAAVPVPVGLVPVNLVPAPVDRVLPPPVSAPVDLIPPPPAPGPVPTDAPSPEPTGLPGQSRGRGSGLSGGLILGALVTTAAAGSVIVLVVGPWMKQPGDAGGGPAPTSTTAATAQDLLPHVVPQPSGSAVRLSPTSVRFTWRVEDPVGLAGYTLTRSDAGSGPRPADQSVQVTHYDLVGVAVADRPCLDVRAADASGATSAPRRICVVQ